MMKMKRLKYLGPEGFIQGVGAVRPGMVVELPAQMARELMAACPEHWDDRAAADETKPLKPKRSKPFRVSVKKGGS